MSSPFRLQNPYERICDAVLEPVEESKALRHVRSAEGERIFHEPLGAVIRPRDPANPILKGKVDKVSIHYPTKGQHSGRPIHRVIQDGATGQLITDHPTFEAADAHVDDVLEKNPHLTSVDHVMRGKAFTVHHSPERYGDVDIHAGGKTTTVKMDTESPLVPQLSALASARKGTGKKAPVTAPGKPGKYEPTLQELINVVGLSKNKDDVEKSGHKFGADISPGDTIVAYSRGGYRRGVATHVGPKRVTFAYVTPSGITEAQKTSEHYKAANNDAAFAQNLEHLRRSSRQNHKWYSDELAKHESGQGSRYIRNDKDLQEFRAQAAKDPEDSAQASQAIHIKNVQANAKKHWHEFVHTTTHSVPREQAAPLANPDALIAGDPLTLAKSYPEITAEDLSTPDARRSRAVSPEEFQKIAAEGERRMEQISSDTSPATGIQENFGEISSQMYAAVKKPWGGMTVDTHTGAPLGESADSYSVFHESHPLAGQYVLTMRPQGAPQLAVPPNVTQKGFQDALREAMTRYAPVLERKGAALGVFHDADLNRIDIDPVLVVNSLHDVETIGAYTRAVGGAYNFSDGLGYWPPHIASTTEEVANDGR